MFFCFAYNYKVMINKLKDVVQNMDFFAATPSLRFRQKTYSGSKCLGFFSLVVVGLLITMLSIRIKNTVDQKKSQITFSFSEQRTSQGGEINELMFGIGFDMIKQNYNLTEFQSYFTIYVKYFSKEEQKMKLEVLKPCRLEQWVNLGQNYTYWFYQYYFLNESYCPERPLNITVLDLDQKFFTFYFSQCDQNLTNNSCDGQNSNLNFFQQKYHLIKQAQICFLTKTIRINYPNPERYDIKMFYFDIQDTKYTKKTKLYFGQLDRYTIQNDKNLFSVFPITTTIQEIQGISFVNSIHSINIYKPLSPRIYIEFNLELSQRVLVWTRSRSQIDVILSDIGGLQEIIVLALILFLKSYDEIKYELTIAGSSFNYNTDGYKIRRQDLNAWTYVKYLTFRFVQQLCCYELPLEESKKMMETVEQGNQILDVKTLFRRLEFLEKVVQQNLNDFNKNWVKILSVTKGSHLEKVKNQRLMICYYENIIKLKEAGTVEDAIAQSSKSFAYLDKKPSLLSFQSQWNINELDENQIKKRKNEIEQSLIKDLKLDKQVSEAISEYPEIVEQAQKIKLNQQKAQTEKKIALQFNQLTNDQEKRNLIMKIPIIILHRIRMRTIEIENKDGGHEGDLSSQKINLIKIQDKKQTTKKKIKKLIEEALKFSDFFSCEPFLRSGKKPEKSTASLGFFDFLIILVFTYVGTVLLKNLFQFNIKQLTIYTYQDRSVNKKSISNIMFAFKFPTVDLSDQIDYTFEQSSFFTIHYSLNENSTTKELQMVRCNAQNWILLGQNYYEQFTKQQLGKAYCLPQLLNITSLGTKLDEFMVEAQISFDCGNTQDPNCKQLADKYYKKVIEQYKNFPIDVYILAPKIIADQKNPLNYTLKKKKIHLPNSTAGLFYQEYSGRQIITDHSIWPFIARQENIKTYVPENIYLYFYKNQKHITGTVFSFYCRQDVEVTERKIGKLDQILSYIGGLFGIFVSFFGIFFSSFNKYRFETNVGENSFNFDSDGKKFSERDLTTVEYVKYTIFKWLREICCRELKWKNSKKMARTLEEVEELLDVEKLFKRLQHLQRVIYQYAGQKFLSVMALVEHDSLQEIKQKRMVLQYYNLIVQHKPAASVEDAIKQKIEAFDYLKSLKVVQSGRRRQNLMRSITKKKSQLIENRRIQQMKKSFRQDLKLDDKVCEALVWYPQIADQAQEIYLDYKWQYIQEQITLAFLKLSPQNKKKIIEKIPIIIMHRLRMKAKKMNELTKSLQQVHQQNIFMTMSTTRRVI